MKMVSIMAFNFNELNDKAKYTALYWLDDFPIDYEDEDGKVWIEYASDWDEPTINEFCRMNDYLFDKNGTPIHHLIEG